MGSKNAEEDAEEEVKRKGESDSLGKIPVTNTHELSIKII